MRDFICNIIINKAYIFLALKQKKLPKPIIKTIICFEETIIILNDLLYFTPSLMKPKFSSHIKSEKNKYTYYFKDELLYTDQAEFKEKHILIDCNYYRRKINALIDSNFCSFNYYILGFKVHNFSKKFLVNYINLCLFSDNVLIKKLLAIPVPNISLIAQKKINSLVESNGILYLSNYVKLIRINKQTSAQLEYYKMKI